MFLKAILPLLSLLAIACADVPTYGRTLPSPIDPLIPELHERPASRSSRGLYYYTDTSVYPNANYLIDPLRPNFRLALTNPADLKLQRPIIIPEMYIQPAKLTNNDEKSLPIMTLTQQLPQQVRDTPEVEQAKKEHFRAHELAKANLDIAAKKDLPIQYYQLPYAKPSFIPGSNIPYGYGYGQPLTYGSNIIPIALQTKYA